MIQKTMFGNFIEYKEPEKPSRKFIKMQKQHGTLEGFICGNCKHFIRHEHNRTYFKCELWYISNSEATDIRKKDVACRKYEEESK